MTEVDSLVAAGAATALAAATAAVAAALATHQDIGIIVLAAGAVLACRAVLAAAVLAADGHFFYIHNQHFFSA